MRTSLHLDILAANLVSPFTDFPNRDERWVDVGSDAVRSDLLDRVERLADLDLSDSQREGIQTVGDLFDLIERRADA